jgi:hypothetical protein
MREQMKRDRPYSGQAHTHHGERGKQLIEGLTMRDVADCYYRAVLLSAGHLVPELYDEACKGENAAIYPGDLYGFDLNKLDPGAIGQNLICEIERAMGIFPNLPDRILCGGISAGRSAAMGGRHQEDPEK